MASSRASIADDPALDLLIPLHVDFWALAAGYLALFSVLLFPGPFALATGIMGLVRIRRTPGARGHVRAWLGIIMGSLGTIGLGIVAVIAMNQ